MRKYKVYVYAICKNEEEFVDRWMDAVSEADAVIVTDTGSTDQTVKKLRERGAVVYEEIISPWRFDTARNIAMSHVPEEADICVSNDLDEIFEEGWRERLEAAWKESTTRAGYWFVWSHHEDGRANKRYPMEKIHRRQDFRWVHPVHEVLEYGGTEQESKIWVEDLVLHHYPDLSKPRSQYLPLLELSAKENPLDDRGMFWLGREYFYYGKYDLGIETLKKHLELPTARWKEERSASMGFIARCYEGKGDMTEAKSWLYRAIAECPDVREPYLDLVQLGYREKNWPLVWAIAQKGLAITQRGESYLVRPESWGEALYDYGAIAAYNMGLYEEARKYALEACRYKPEEERLKKNLALIEQKRKEEKGG